jgi:hypothetical protein
MIEFSSTIKNGLPVLIKITGYTAPTMTTWSQPGDPEDVEFTICWPNGAAITGKLLRDAGEDWERLYEEAIKAVHEFAEDCELEWHLDLEAGR